MAAVTLLASLGIGDRVVGPGLVQYGDLLLGRCAAAGEVTPYRLISLEGWEETPGLDSGTVLRSGEHGAFPGRLYAQTRTITAELLIRAGRDGMGAALQALNAGTSPVADEEVPLVIQTDDRGPLLAYARVMRRSIPVGKTYRLGTVTGAALQWEATDPRRYELVQRTAVTALPQAETGLVWTPDGLVWLPNGLVWGSTTSTGNIGVDNAGDAACHPLVDFTGPVDTPSLTNLGTGQSLEYDIELGPADTLTVDTWAGTVLLNGSVSRLYTATLRSVPEADFTLPPGPSTLAFRHGAGASSPAATCTVRWRSAFW